MNTIITQKKLKDNNMSKLSLNKNDFYTKISDLLISAKKAVVQSVNKTIVITYYEIGRLIVEEEQ